MYIYTHIGQHTIYSIRYKVYGKHINTRVCVYIYIYIYIYNIHTYVQIICFGAEGGQFKDLDLLFGIKVDTYTVQG